MFMMWGCQAYTHRWYASRAPLVEHFDLRQLKQEEEEGPEVPGKVPNGGGCVKGLDELEHVERARTVEHGSCVSPQTLPRGLMNAMEYEASRLPCSVDADREKIVQSWLREHERFIPADDLWTGQQIEWSIRGLLDQ